MKDREVLKIDEERLKNTIHSSCHLIHGSAGPAAPACPAGVSVIIGLSK